jgi:hypothetical protein
VQDLPEPRSWGKPRSEQPNQQKEPEQKGPEQKVNPFPDYFEVARQQRMGNLPESWESMTTEEKRVEIDRLKSEEKNSRLKRLEKRVEPKTSADLKFESEKRAFFWIMVFIVLFFILSAMDRGSFTNTPYRKPPEQDVWNTPSGKEFRARLIIEQEARRRRGEWPSE